MIDCKKCTHCFDNEEQFHFWRCDKHGICVDCWEVYCEGKDFKNE
ncbi:hypothetical protein LCGC14_0712300 [marine sediment metagenome]|uniref:Uncharacterized protein n=1 Tax=marine sediment metagenome TaxID=412755 RepID=A0A0F9QJ78_9ZZZZ